MSVLELRRLFQQQQQLAQMEVEVQALGLRGLDAQHEVDVAVPVGRRRAARKPTRFLTPTISTSASHAMTQMHLALRAGLEDDAVSADVQQLRHVVPVAPVQLLHRPLRTLELPTLILTTKS
eukprot:113124-Rhodomonas_salina.3